MIRKFKKYLKIAIDNFWDLLFKNVKLFSFLKHYPKGRNHLYDILIEEKTNLDFVVFDVGANIGQSALYYNKLLKNPKIYSFEPVFNTFEQLKSNINKPNISLFNYALGANNGYCSIKLNSDCGLNSLVKEVNSKMESTAIQSVEIKTLTDLCKEIKIDRIDILKIDTEGYDLEVLKGANELLEDRKIKYIYCEVAFNNEPDKGNFYEINKILRTYDFWLCGFYEPSRWGANFSYLSFANALFKQIR